MNFVNSNCYLSWEPELDDQLGYFSNTPCDLKRDLATGGTSVDMGRCAYSSEEDYPFHRKATVLNYRLFYPCTFTPFWDAYCEGTTIYYHDDSGEWMRIPRGTLVCDQTYWSNDFTYSDEVPSGFEEVEKVDYCTWGQLAEWLAAGCGFVRLPDGSVSRWVGFSADQWDLPVPNDYAVRGFNMIGWVPPTKRFVDLD